MKKTTVGGAMCLIVLACFIIGLGICLGLAALIHLAFPVVGVFQAFAVLVVLSFVATWFSHK